MARKVFGVSNKITDGIRDTLTAVENNINNFRFSIVKLSQIELDPENPRDLHLTISDVEGGLNSKDPQYTQKKMELESLQSLAETIRMKGVINPIVLYKYENKYRLVAGERRYLASHIANKTDIQARILSELPSTYDLRRLQWIENNEREDLSLKERINNIQSIMNAYKVQFNKDKLVPTDIKHATGLSLPQSTYYLRILEASEDVLLAIDENKIQNLDKAAFLASINNGELRQNAIQFCYQGATLKELKALVSTSRRNESKKKPGRVPHKINLGSTTNSKLVKTIIHKLIEMPELKNYEDRFQHVNWTKPRESTKAFQLLISLLEEKFGENK